MTPLGDNSHNSVLLNIIIKTILKGDALVDAMLKIVFSVYIVLSVYGVFTKKMINENFLLQRIISKYIIYSHI